MNKFDNIINAITDNIVLFLILFVIFSWLLRCSSTQQADTIRLTERSQAVNSELDAITEDCSTVRCKQALTNAKQLISDSMDTLTEKDSEIKSKQEEIANQTIYTQTGKFIIWGSVIIVIIGLLYTFRDSIIKIIRPI